MSETRVGRIDVADTTANAMTSFLKFVYTNSCEAVGEDGVTFGDDGLVGTWHYTSFRSSFQIAQLANDMERRGIPPGVQSIDEHNMLHGAIQASGPKSWKVDLS